MTFIDFLKIFFTWFIPFVCAGGIAIIVKKLKGLKEHNDALDSALLSIIRSQLVSKCENYMNQGYLPEYARYCLEDLFNQYKTLGGNHGIEVLVEQCFNLPLSLKK